MRAMKKLLLAIILICAAPVFCHAQGIHYVNGYVTRAGVYVPGHWETNANGNFYDNWSTRGNYNPYTGKPGWITQPPARPWVPQRAGYYDAFGVWHPGR